MRRPRVWRSPGTHRPVRHGMMCMPEAASPGRCTRGSSSDRKMRLYNTLTRHEEEFAPSRDNTVRMYTCGLTIYNRGHIGNFRTFICMDVLRRTLKYIGGWQMRHVVNFTDVDDKTIAGAQREGVSLREYTDRYIAAFHEDSQALGI